MWWCEQGIRVMLVGIQQILNNRHNLSDTVAPPWPGFPQQHSVCTGISCCNGCREGGQGCSVPSFKFILKFDWVHDFIINETVSHEFNKVVDGKKDESFVVHIDGPRKCSFRIVQVFFKSSWDYLGTLKAKKNTKTILLKGEKSRIQMKTIFKKRKKEMDNRYNQNKSILAFGYVDEICDALLLSISNNKIHHEFFWESRFISLSRSLSLILINLKWSIGFKEINSLHTSGHKNKATEFQLQCYSVLTHMLTLRLLYVFIHHIINHQLTWAHISKVRPFGVFGIKHIYADNCNVSFIKP